MTPERWQRVKQLLQTALEEQPERRAALLTQVCADDIELRIEVESLIAHYQQADQFLETPALSAAAQLLAQQKEAVRIPHSNLLTVGDLLQNRYLIVRRIGQGGMGAVYEARDQRLGVTVALKQTILSGEHLRKAFEREARLLAKLRHPSLPVVSDHFLEGEDQFLVMQFIPGVDLAELLTRNGHPFPIAEVLRWGDQLLDALEYLHSQQPSVIHRDIKPNNLKLAQDGNIILLDFGLAKGKPDLSQASASNDASLLGFTPHYSPLEQIDGTGTDPRSDLYAWAATLYHLMTGIKPPDATRRALALINAETDPLKPAHLLNPAVPLTISTLLQGAMAQQADRRPSSAALLREALSVAANPADDLISIPHEINSALPTTVAKSADDVPTAIMGTVTTSPITRILYRLRWQPALVVIILLMALTWATPKFTPLISKYFLASPDTVFMTVPKQFGDPGFQGDPISLDISDVELNDLIRFISDNYGVNFVLNESIVKTKVRMKAIDVPWGPALEAVLWANNLAYKRQGQIVYIFPADRLQTEKSNGQLKP
ncbi:MAG: serine/threonine-protein kinase [Acidobacteriota bacterium]